MVETHGEMCDALYFRAYHTLDTTLDFDFDPPANRSTTAVDHSACLSADGSFFEDVRLHRSSLIVNLRDCEIKLEPTDLHILANTTATAGLDQTTLSRLGVKTLIQKKRGTKLASADQYRAIPTDSRGERSRPKRPQRSGKLYKGQDCSAVPTADPKTKIALEKNRLAAAKCRIHKKEKTDALQQEAHQRAAENARLRQQVVLMQEDIHHMQHVLLSHVDLGECRIFEGVIL